jgi:hypothetical protein
MQTLLLRNYCLTDSITQVSNSKIYIFFTFFVSKITADDLSTVLDVE